MPQRQGTETHCVNGHPWTEETIYTTKRGTKTCRRCRKDSNTRYQARLKPAADPRTTEGENRLSPGQRRMLAAVESALTGTDDRSNVLGLRWLRPDGVY